jgi:hypothetical protein
LGNDSERVAIKPDKGYCINCDNRHGCKSKTPPCIMEMEKECVSGASGKQYLIDAGKAGECRGCPFFRSCWNEEEYNRVTGGGANEAR